MGEEVSHLPTIRPANALGVLLDAAVDFALHVHLREITVDAAMVGGPAGERMPIEPRSVARALLSDHLREAACDPDGPVATLRRRRAALDAAHLMTTMTIALAGRAAEERIIGTQSVLVGGEGDLQKATDIALALETRLGLGEVGLMHLGAIAPFRLMLEPEIRKAVRDRLDRCYAEALRLIAENEDALQAIAVDLAARGYLTGDDIEAVIRRARAVKADGQPRPREPAPCKPRKGGFHVG